MTDLITTFLTGLIGIIFTAVILNFLIDDAAGEEKLILIFKMAVAIWILSFFLKTFGHSLSI